MAEIGGGHPWEQLKLTCEIRNEAPRQMWRGAAVGHGSLSYFRSEDVLAYDLEKNTWNELPKCPQIECQLAVIGNFLTAVGGLSGGQETNCLSSFSGGKWVTIFPPMPTKRRWHAVISAQSYLVAAGGRGEEDVPLSTVEVMDCNILKWHTAASLPEPAYLMSATVCGGNLYLLGGRTWNQPKQSSLWRQNLDSTHAVFTCTLDSLLQSCHPPSQTPSCASEASVWQRVTNLPVRGSSCTTLNGRVLAVGGEDSHGDPTALVHMYDCESNSWLVLGNVSTARSWCHVVSLRDCIITVGGIMQTAAQTTALEVGYLQLSGGGCICSV